METLIALVLSAVVIGLVSHAFLVQNQYYSMQQLRTGAQDNVRGATELIAREVRNTPDEGVAIAGRRTLAVRVPMAVGVFCNRVGVGEGDIMTEGGEAALSTDEFAGLAVRQGSDWEYHYTTWATVNGNDALSASACEANGADTVGAYDDFHRLTSLETQFSPIPSEGEVVILFRETTFTIRQSQLDSTTLGLFRASYGAAPVEFATGIDTTAQFQYRTPGGMLDTVSAAAVGSIDAVRIVADARKPAPTGGQDDVRFGWSVMVPLRNVREPG